MSLNNEAMDYFLGKKKPPSDKEFKEKMMECAAILKRYIDNDVGNSILDVFAFSQVLKMLTKNTSSDATIHLAAEVISAQQKRLEAFGLVLVNNGLIPPSNPTNGKKA